MPRHAMRLKTMLTLCVALGVLVSGCMTARQSDTERTGVEQLLLSTAVDRATDDFDLSALAGMAVKVDLSNLEGVDRGYVANSVRERLLQAGARLVDGPADADAVVEGASGGVGTDGSYSIIGLPPISLNVMGSGFSTPEMALFKSSTQYGVAKVNLHARDAKTGEMISASGPQQGDSYYHRYTILIISFRRTDVPGK